MAATAEPTEMGSDHGEAGQVGHVPVQYLIVQEAAEGTAASSGSSKLPGGQDALSAPEGHVFGYIKQEGENQDSGAAEAATTFVLVPEGPLAEEKVFPAHVQGEAIKASGNEFVLIQSDGTTLRLNGTEQFIILDDDTGVGFAGEDAASTALLRSHPDEDWGGNDLKDGGSTRTKDLKQVVDDKHQAITSKKREKLLKAFKAGDASFRRKSKAIKTDILNCRSRINRAMLANHLLQAEVDRRREVLSEVQQRVDQIEEVIVTHCRQNSIDR